MNGWLPASGDPTNDGFRLHRGTPGMQCLDPLGVPGAAAPIQALYKSLRGLAMVGYLKPLGICSSF